MSKWIAEITLSGDENELEDFVETINELAKKLDIGIEIGDMYSVKWNLSNIKFESIE